MRAIRATRTQGPQQLSLPNNTSLLSKMDVDSWLLIHSATEASTLVTTSGATHAGITMCLLTMTAWLPAHPHAGMLCLFQLATGAGRKKKPYHAPGVERRSPLLPEEGRSPLLE